MAAKYDVRNSSDGQYYFNLKAANGKIILTNERYTTKANALKGIDSVRTNATMPVHLQGWPGQRNPVRRDERPRHSTR